MLLKFIRLSTVKFVFVQGAASAAAVTATAAAVAAVAERLASDGNSINHVFIERI